MMWAGVGSGGGYRTDWLQNFRSLGGRRRQPRLSVAHNHHPPPADTGRATGDSWAPDGRADLDRGNITEEILQRKYYRTEHKSTRVSLSLYFILFSLLQISESGRRKTLAGTNKDTEYFYNQKYFFSSWEVQSMTSFPPPSQQGSAASANIFNIQTKCIKMIMDSHENVTVS